MGHTSYPDVVTRPSENIDLTNLPRFLKHLGHHERDPMAASFAQQLLDDGGQIVEFWGPEQMDVWGLTIRRGHYLLRFGVERGYSDSVTFLPAEAADVWPSPTLLKFAVFAWARAHGVELVLDDPDRFHADLPAYGIRALDWLEAGHEEILVKIDAAYDEGRLSLGSIFYPSQDAERKANQIRLMEAAAATGTA